MTANELLALLAKIAAVFIMAYSTYKIFDHALYLIAVNRFPDEIIDSASKDPEIIEEAEKTGQSPEDIARDSIRIMKRYEIFFILIYLAAFAFGCVALATIK